MSKPEDFLGVFVLNPQKKFGLEIGAAVMVTVDEDILETTPEGFPLIRRNFQSIQTPRRLIEFVLGTPLTAITQGSSGLYYICLNKDGDTVSVEKTLWEDTVRHKLERLAETTIT